MCLLNICPRIIIAVPFEKVDSSPEAQPRAEGHHEGLEHAYRCLKKCHVNELGKRIFAFRRLAGLENSARNCDCFSGLCTDSRVLSLEFVLCLPVGHHAGGPRFRGLERSQFPIKEPPFSAVSGRARRGSSPCDKTVKVPLFYLRAVMFARPRRGFPLSKV